MTVEVAGVPSFLIVPGLNNSGTTHWQTLWQALLRNSARADLGDWGNPDRDTWVDRLDEAIKSLKPPVLLCAHSLGCHAVAWWAAMKAKADGWPVSGALLIAPPDCENREKLPTASGFSPMPMSRLQFPSFVVGSRDDEYASLDDAKGMARQWGSRFIDIGCLGHINSDSKVGHWPVGLHLLSRLIGAGGLGRA